MRIAHLTYTYLPLVGGGDVYVENLRLALAARGHDQIVLARVSTAAAPWFIPVPNPLRGRPAEFWTHALALLRRRATIRAQDAVVAHYPIYALAAARIGGRRGPRIVGISHGVTWDDRPGALRSRVKCALARAAFRRCDAFVANDSAFLREMGLDVAPGQRFFEEIAPGRWFIPNCVHTDDFCPGPGRADLRAAPAIIVPRNLYYNRGVHLAIAAYARFRPAHPDTRLVIIGAASQPAYVRTLHDLVRALGLTDHVEFRGAVAHGDMPAVYQSAEMVVIPSVAGEGTSLSALEAMACGAATVTTDIGGLADLPTVQCPPDAARLAQALLETYAQRAAVGARQRDRTLEVFNRRRWEEAWGRVMASLEWVSDGL